MCHRLPLAALHKLRGRSAIVNVTGPTASKVKAFADLTGARRYTTDYRKVLQDSEVEAVVICYRWEMNYQITKDALDCMGNREDLGIKDWERCAR